LFEFQSDVSEKKFKNSVDVDPVLYISKKGDVDIYIVVDNPIPNLFLNKIKNYVSHIDKNLSFQIISALPFKPKEKDLKKSIFELYAKNGTDLKKYIKPYSKIITIGRGLYDVLYGNDLSIEGFYDTLQWNTSFYDPKTQSQVFPCSSYFSWLDKDTFESFFTCKQIKFARDYKVPKIRIRKPNLVYLDTKEKCSELLNNRILYKGVVSWDLETKRLSPWAVDGKIICLTLCFEDDPYTGYFLPWQLIDTELLNSFFFGKKLIGNNSKFDIKWLVVNGTIKRDNIHIFWDNMKSSHAINELQFNSLKSDAWLDTCYGGYDFELENYKMKFPACKEDYSLIPTSILYPYATMDSCVSMMCYLKHQEIIDSMDKQFVLTNGWSIRRALEDVAFPAFETFTDIELHGMCYDWEKLDKLSNELSIKLAEKRKELYKFLNMPEIMNVDSGDQLGKFLESKGWENPGRSKKGLYLTNDASMKYWKKKGHKEVDFIQEYTEYSTVMKTFVGVKSNSKGEPTGYYQYKASDGKIHGTFRCMMADSWRGKSYDPNLQNIIKSSTVYLGTKEFIVEEFENFRKESKKIKISRNNKVIEIDSLNILDSDTCPIPLHVRVRECFTVPSEDYVLSENDGKGLQLHIAATYSHDPVMEDIFKNRGGDMHSITGNQVFCSDVSLDYFIAHKNEKLYKTYRKKAKSVNFGFLFGESSRAFASSTLQAEWTVQEAKDYVKDTKLEDKQSSFFKYLIKDIPFDVVDKECFIQDQLEFSYYWASAEDIRKKFFETYKGLKSWHDKQHAFAKKNGYVQSLWGPIRRTPYLIYQGKDDDKSRIKNYENISLNSPVQNFEAMYMMYNMARSDKDLKALNTYFIGNIHDSAIDYMKKSEIEQVKNIFVKYFHEQMNLMEGIPYEMEFGYSDLAKGDVWGITEHEF